MTRCRQQTCSKFVANEAPILEFDSSGKFLKSFGQGMFAEPHSLKVDKDDNVWAADVKGNQVVKFSREGKVLLTLGTKGVMGGGRRTTSGRVETCCRSKRRHFRGRRDTPYYLGVAENGMDKARASKNDPTHVRIAKFSKDGKFIKSWGKLGTGPGDFNVPHGLAMDSQGRLFVADVVTVAFRFSIKTGNCWINGNNSGSRTAFSSTRRTFYM